jgi:hypothetical protein
MCREGASIKESRDDSYQARLAKGAGLVVADRWTTLLVALWVFLCCALFVNKAELWVALAAVVGYSLLSFLFDIGLSPAWSGVKPTLTNGLVSIAHALVTWACIGESSSVSMHDCACLCVLGSDGVGGVLAWQYVAPRWL